LRLFLIPQLMPTNANMVLKKKKLTRKIEIKKERA